jgi:AcrR family transcriptional regulator
MSRRTPPGRVRDIARAACRVFIEKGYQRALMTDVARKLGLSHAILYRYVESKEALFHLAVLYATNPGALPELTDLTEPMPTPAPGETLALIDKWLAENASYPVLAAALAGESRADISRELSDIIDERYAFAEQNRRLFALIEQSALDIPELHTLYYIQSRRDQVAQLARYLEQRCQAGLLRRVPEVATAARFIVETIAWFAWHRRSDPDSAMIGDDDARQTAKFLILAAFIPDAEHDPGRVRSRRARSSETGAKS